jgi:phosphate transport system permease protein
MIDQVINRKLTSIRLVRLRKNRTAQRIMQILTLSGILLVPMLGIALLVRSMPILQSKSLPELLLSQEWNPVRGEFGFLPFIMGTLWVTVIAMLIAIPPSLLSAIYLAEYAPDRVRTILKPFIDLLAGIPSVVYGVWGVLVIVPFVGDYVGPLINQVFGYVPLFQTNNPTGYGLLAGGLVLAVMVFPFIITVSEEVIGAVPDSLRESSLALGATRWETIKKVVLQKAWPGVLAAVVLGFTRALGETMAVLMVVGNVVQVPRSIFDAAYPLTALIANNYGEMMSIPLYDSALMMAALVLLVIVLIFNLVSRLILIRLVRED